MEIKPIKSERDYNKALKRLELIFDAKPGSADGDELEAVSYTHLDVYKRQVLGYFGDNIQDFPNIMQADAIKQDPNSDFYTKFGQEYFSLPNPGYGSWEHNQFN